MLSLIVLYGGLAACASVATVMVLRYDLHDREPWYTLAAACVIGAVLMYLAGQAQSRLIWDAVERAPDLVGSTLFSVLAGVTEETAKLLAVVIVLLVFRRHFNDPLDGIVYGSMAGLGAAIEESIWVVGFPSGPPLLPATEPIRLAGHLVMGGIAGWGLGLFATRDRWRWGFTLLCLGVAIAAHVAWDYAAFEAATASKVNGQGLSWHTLQALVVMSSGLLIYRHLIVVGQRRSDAIPDVKVAT